MTSRTTYQPNWLLAGLLLACAFLAAVVFVKPIGVSTQFVIATAAIWDQLDPTVLTEDATTKTGWTSSNAYLAKSSGKYAENASNLMNYSFVFVLAMMGGVLLSAFLKGDRPVSYHYRQMPPLWRQNFGDCPWRRYAISFAAGFIVLFGARLAGGCTSGHMMSGMMQTALSGYIFAAAAFATAIPLALVLYRKS